MANLSAGAWINAADGHFAYVDEHADWVKRPGNLERIGLPASVWETIRNIPNDYGGENRKSILMIVMAAGGIRMRGHGDFVTFEFMCDPKVALPACRGVLAQIAGPLTRCRFNSLGTNETVEVFYADYVRQMDNDVNQMEDSTSLRWERP
jgi:hypothetical protein